jgi:hypothetical protein
LTHCGHEYEPRGKNAILLKALCQKLLERALDRLTRKSFSSLVAVVAWAGYSPIASSQTQIFDIPKSWIEVSADGWFSLKAPDGTTFSRGQGIDSFIGRFTVRDNVLRFDYGWYSPTISDYANRPYASSVKLKVDGKDALVVWDAAQSPVTERGCRNGQYYVALYVHDTRVHTGVMLRSDPTARNQIPAFTIEPPSESLEPAANLYMGTCVSSFGDIDLMRRIYQTIKFSP